MAEQLTLNQLVPGSSPGRGTTLCERNGWFHWHFLQDQCRWIVLSHFAFDRFRAFRTAADRSQNRSQAPRGLKFEYEGEAFKLATTRPDVS